MASEPFAELVFEGTYSGRIVWRPGSTDRKMWRVLEEYDKHDAMMSEVTLVLMLQLVGPCIEALSDPLGLGKGVDLDRLDEVSVDSPYDFGVEEGELTWLPGDTFHRHMEIRSPSQRQKVAKYVQMRMQRLVEQHLRVMVRVCADHLQKTYGHGHG